MEWARSNTFRGLVVGMLVIFVALQVTQREWSWVAVGSALLVLNLLLWRRHRAITGRGRASAPVVVSASLVMEPGVDATLTELLDRPAVQQVWSTGPAVWKQVSYLDDADGLELSAAEVADYVWILTHDDETVRQMQTHWSVGVGDELKPLLDLDIAEDDDQLVATLASHPAVAEAEHTDREQYHVVLRAPLTLDDMAALAARGLIAHHIDAVRRLLP